LVRGYPKNDKDYYFFDEEIGGYILLSADGAYQVSGNGETMRQVGCRSLDEILGTTTHYEYVGDRSQLYAVQ
jgi:hypothetical protein